MAILSVGIHGGDLIVRMDPGQAEQALKEPGVRIFDITGRPTKGWLLVSSNALEKKAVLRKWVNKVVTYARSLPPKSK